VKKVTKAKTSQTKQECENCDFLYEIIENARVQLEEMQLWLSCWGRNPGGKIPGFDGYTAKYPEWPLTVTIVYHWPREIKRGITVHSKENIARFLERGVEQETLVYRHYQEGYDWHVLNPNAYEQLLSEFGFSENSFGVQENDRYLELQRSREDVIRGIRPAKNI